METYPELRSRGSTPARGGDSLSPSSQWRRAVATPDSTGSGTIWCERWRTGAKAMARHVRAGTAAGTKETSRRPAAVVLAGTFQFHGHQPSTEVAGYLRTSRRACANADRSLQETEMRRSKPGAAQIFGIDGAFGAVLPHPSPLPAGEGWGEGEPSGGTGAITLAPRFPRRIARN